MACWLLSLMGCLTTSARVLDLADWQQVIKQFASSEDDTSLLLGPAVGALVGGRHQVTVIFDSQDHADLAGPAILKLPGVLDVRHTR